jgi:hypothetical protein
VDRWLLKMRLGARVLSIPSDEVVAAEARSRGEKVVTLEDLQRMVDAAKATLSTFPGARVVGGPPPPPVERTPPKRTPPPRPVAKPAPVQVGIAFDQKTEKPPAAKPGGANDLF